MDETPHCATVVGQDGHNYFHVDRDRSKGDRRSDGKLNAEFFAVEASSVTINNVRVSQRLRRMCPDTVEVELVADSLEEVENETNEVDSVADNPEEGGNIMNVADNPEEVENVMNEGGISDWG
jgi:hypothetical protein